MDVEDEVGVGLNQLCFGNGLIASSLKNHLQYMSRKSMTLGASWRI